MQRPQDALFYAELYHSSINYELTSEADEVIAALSSKFATKPGEGGPGAGVVGEQDAAIARCNLGASPSEGAQSLYGGNVRSVYWLALCRWHLGELTAVYALLRPVVVEPFDEKDGEGTTLAVEDDLGQDSDGFSSEGDLGRKRREKGEKCSSNQEEEYQRIRIGVWWLMVQVCVRLEKWHEAEDLAKELVQPCREFVTRYYCNKATRSDDDTTVAESLGYVLLPSETRCRVPDQATIIDILGQICRRTNRPKQAIEYFRQELRLNPFSWTAIEGLSQIGADIDILDDIKLTPATRGLLEAWYSQDELAVTNGKSSSGDNDGGGSSNSSSNSNNTVASGTNNSRALQPLLSQKPQQLPPHPRRPLTASGGRNHSPDEGLAIRPSSSSSTSHRLVTGSSVAGHQRNRSSTSTGPTHKRRVASVGQSAVTAASIGRSISAMKPPPLPSATNPPSWSASISGGGGDKKRTREPPSSGPPSEQQARDSGNATKRVAKADAVEDMLTLVKCVYAARIHQINYRPHGVVCSLARLAPSQRNSPWALCLLGKTCFESGLYDEAEQAFSAAHHIDPHRLRDMDIYSTLLWHMRRESQLAQLAHSLIDVARNWGPEAWLATANLFSLKGSHGSALKCLARAIQLYATAATGIATTVATHAGSVGRTDGCNITSVPGLAYAHTLCGHEHSANNDYDRAQHSFRTAVRIDPRHYNAWYGLGMLYLRLGKLDLAEYHFNKAIEINSANPVLQCCIGMVLERRGKCEAALEVYRQILSPTSKDAISCHPASQIESLVLFKLSRVLVALGRYKEAAKELEALALKCPQEATVFFLLGQTYKQLREYRKAMANFMRAQDIDSRCSQAVKDAFETLYDAEDSGSGGNLSGYGGDPSREWRSDWDSLNHADDRVNRALDF
ncbi:anaphase-promoting complex subunit cdc27 [Spiromyces aspiralis]|uniref:Anaphase-promoting complex subunit cdc27 n=1 Tax=Spiromyces aspiralis TaxID=68401 RepID=A0ACC1HKB6_9FUNG|nr:anaphase-promoting complex subunit cdc27 [Spiromyces aspiralis]